MKSTTRALCALAASIAAAGAPAAEYFVDAVNGSDDWDGTCAAHVSGTTGPKRTLQAAVDLVADDGGNVVTALPGVYDQGGRPFSATKHAHTNRVSVTRRNVTIRSRDGMEATHIVGAPDPNGGCGPAAVRCVMAGGVSMNVVVEGFTIRDGRSSNAAGSSSEDRGGGAVGVILYGCAVSNNVAYSRGGGANQCRLIRCRVAGNSLEDGNYGAAANASDFSNCLVAGNHGGATMSYASTLVNTTVVGNRGGGALLASADAKVYNCVFAGNHEGLNGFSKASAAGSSECHATVAERAGFFASADSASVTNAPLGQCVSSAFGDGRPVAGSAAVGRGDAAYLASVELPEGRAHLDLDGAALPASGAVNAGCYQSSVAPAGGLVDFGSQYAWNDGAINKYASHHFTDPAQTLKVKPKLAEGARLYGVYSEAEGSDMRIPLLDGYVRVFATPAASEAISLKVREAEGVVYVDAANGSDDWDGSSAAHVSGTAGPKRTLAGASAAVTGDWTLVMVAPGTYDSGTAASGTVASRLSDGGKAVGFVSSAGSQAASIVGGEQTRCVYLSSRGSFVQGFTLVGGSSLEDSTDAHRGAAFYSMFTACYVLDCLVTNCAAVSAVAYRGTMQRCRVVDCRTLDGPLAYLTVCANSLFAGNSFDRSGSGQTHFYDRAIVACCTVDAGGGRVWNANVNAAVGNVVVDGSGSDSDARCHLCNLEDADPLFASRERRDYRLGSLSPALGLVDPASLSVSNAYRYLTADVSGRELRSSGGRLDAGAVHAEPLPCVVVGAAGGGGVTVGNGVVGTNVVSESSEALTLSADATRPFVGFAVDGEIVARDMAWSFAPGGEAAAVTTVAAVYTNAWHVSQAAGDDGNSGADWARAKRTIRAAAERAVAGDVIRVAAGVYGESDGTMLQSAPVSSGTPTIRCRVWVKEGVTLESSEGAERTLIVGARASSPADAYGNGADAVRGVALAANAVVRGFTITGCASAASESANYADDYLGAVAGTSWETSRVEDCIVSNNVAACAAPGYDCTFVRTRIVGNTATARASAGRSCAYVGCVIDSNLGPNLCEQFYAFDSCTLGPGNYALNGTSRPTALQYPLGGARVVNSAVMHPKVAARDEKFPFVAANTFYLKGCGLDEADESFADCRFLDAAAFALDGDLRPVVGESPLVDAARVELSCADAGAARDASGFQRVMNGARDVGALEGDWRGTFARDVSKSRKFAVMEASPEVREDPETRRVRIPGASTLVCRWKAPGTRYAVRVLVVGGGELSVSHNGEALPGVTAQDGEREFSLVASADGDELALAYSGDGYCELVDALGRMGGIMVIR